MFQDTVIALQALAEMAALVFPEYFDLVLDVSGRGFRDTFYINPNNSRVLQSREVFRLKSHNGFATKINNKVFKKFEKNKNFHVRLYIYFPSM